MEESYQGHCSASCICERWVNLLHYWQLSTKMESSSASSKCYFVFYRHISSGIFCCTLSCHLCLNNKISWNVCLVRGVSSQVFFFCLIQKYQSKVVFQTLFPSILLFSLICTTLKHIPVWWCQSFAENAFTASHCPWSQVQTLKHNLQSPIGADPSSLV